MLFLAIRHLLARKRQTGLILFGISLGTMVYVAISGIQLGFRAYFVEKLINNNAHVQISGPEEQITPESVRPLFFQDQLVRWIVPPSGKREEAKVQYPQGWFSRLRGHSDVISYAPQIHTQAIFTRGDVKSAAQVIGIDVDRQKQVTNFASDIKEGRLESVARGGNRLIVGSGLANKIGALMNDTVFVTTGTKEAIPFKIAAIYHSGVQQLDDAIAYASILDVQQLVGTPGAVTNISVRLSDVSLAKPLAQQWSLISKDRVQSWEEANAGILGVFQIQDLIRNFITSTVLIVAAFGIYNVLSIIINQKKREIAILRALGFSPKEVQNLFILQGAILGVAGAITGLILGFLACKGLENISFKGAGFDKMVVSYDISIYLYGIVMSVGSALAAGYFPARAAKNMTPVEIIRAEV